MIILDGLPDTAKYIIAGILIILGVLGGYILQDTWREPDQRSNIVLRSVGYFWVETAPEVYQIGAVMRIYNLGSQTTFLRGIVLDAAQPQITGRGQSYLRRLTFFEPKAEAKDDNFVKAASDARYKLMLPIRMEAKIVFPPPAQVAYVGTWKLKFRSSERAVTPEQTATYERVITRTEWDTLLKPTSTIPADAVP